MNYGNIFLNFLIEENPLWHSRRSLNNDQLEARRLLSSALDLGDVLPADDEPPVPAPTMLNDIAEFRLWYDDLLKDGSKAEFRNRVIENFKSIFVYIMSVSEDEGVQNFSDTTAVKKLVDKTLTFSNMSSEDTENGNYLKVCDKFPDFSKQEKATANMFVALKASEISARNLERAKEGLVIVIDELNSWHGIMMRGLIPSSKAGRCRQGNEPVVSHIRESYDSPTYHKHQYPPGDEVKKLFVALNDYFNGSAEDIFKNTSADSVQRVERIIKLSGWSLLFYLALHPYSDGNGRISRLFCSYILGSIVPFPVGIFNIFSPTTKDDYLQALMDDKRGTAFINGNFADILMNCRPKRISAMVLESCWHACRCFRKCFDLAEATNGMVQVPQALNHNEENEPPEKNL